MEKRVEIKGDNVILEGAITHNSLEKAAVVTHPHPLYGGTMDNAVVQVISQAYHARNYTTLRFNFRGVGGSTGRYGDGEGEQKDLESALHFLSESGIKSIDIAGYSFGSWIIFELASSIGLNNRIILISPPIDFIRFSAHSQLCNLSSVIVGSKDDYAPVNRLQTLVSSWNSVAQFKVLEGANHFYSGYLNDLQKLLENSI
jgi:hypothetical protein